MPSTVKTCECGPIRGRKRRGIKGLLCGQPAMCFLVHGQLSSCRMWLCEKHEQKIRDDYHWKTQRLSPPNEAE